MGCVISRPDCSGNHESNFAHTSTGSEPLAGAKSIKFLSDYKDLFEDNDIDAVIVCTPNFHHVQG